MTSTEASTDSQPISLWWDLLPAEMTTAFGTQLDGDVECDVAIVGGGWFYTHQQSQSLDSMAALQEAAVMFSRPVSVDPQPGTQAFVT